MTADGETVQDAHEPRFFVVGIGASAGGLEAITALMTRTTVDGAAFVVVQHLAPNQNSMLTELLGRASPLKVVTVEHGMAVAVNHVYVTPPNAELGLKDGKFVITRPTKGTRLHLPIDVFFRSLALEQGARAMGVVLSGTGTDGTFGLAAIKAAGGITFVQEPSTAKFDGMPRSALSHDVPDFCLAPEAIADEILRVSSQPYTHLTGPRLSNFQEHIGALGMLLRSSFGLDLSHYKLNTVERRTQRRMAVHKIALLEDYVRFCTRDPREIGLLYKDLLINVTCFFRDGDPFEALEKEIIPRLLDRKSDMDTIRVWTPGCSSGEESYSVAMCLLDVLDARGSNIRIQIFGTDIDADAVQQARRGVYAPNIVTDVSPERIRKYFSRTDDGLFQISRRVRDCVVFSTQNISKDAPFSKLDLITCRNLLIYLQSSSQRKVLRILHYALRPEGYLMLGTSETVGDASDLFSLIDRQNKIYAAKHVALVATPFDLDGGAAMGNQNVVIARAPAARPAMSIAHLADRKILEQHAPPGVVINENLDIIYFRGRTQAFLQQPSGVATHNILRMVRSELHSTLKHAVESVFAKDEPVSVAAHVRVEGAGILDFTLVAQPMQEPETRARCVLILFKQTPRPEAGAREEAGAAVPPTSETGERSTQMLKQELALTRDHLQGTIEELERSNEDLKSANEELQSTNEELQSTNEELETSKEELQSTNEELITLNDELQNRMRELSTANDDLNNVLLGVDRAIIIVGLDLRIRRFTQSAEKLLRLLPSDVGRSAAQLNGFLGGFGFEKMVADAIETISTVVHEVQATDHRWYLLRIVPYRTGDRAIRGAVISLTDIELSKRRVDLTSAVAEYAVGAFAAVQHPLLIINRELTVIWANEGYYKAFQLLPEEVVGVRVGKIGTGEWAGPELRKLMADTLDSGAPFRNHGLEFTSPALGSRRVVVSGSLVQHVANETHLMLLSIEGDFSSPLKESGQ